MTISRVLRLVPAAVLVLGLSACTDDDPDTGDTPSASATGSTGSTPEATSPAPETSAPETPSVVPATGKEIGVATVSMRLTDVPGWRLTKTDVIVVALLHPATGGTLKVIVQDSPNQPGRDTDDEAAGWERTLAVEPAAPTRVANRVLDQVECFVLDGRTDELRHYVVGGVVGDRHFLLQFQVPAEVADGDQLIEQMLASIDIKDR
ncbi:hypothetical protein [Nocardioides nitrophenolicus]|uniref:hypothetical protein n=1 Tax=Nocardioides nitrophenolicus TaxID=60489 RepID=UPI0019569617|nr:hypothetical protein [Nocardioides nitrophenolicus]MBM7516174.1 hypothetical protein [Nocardioides nitrophenolicus]